GAAARVRREVAVLALRATQALQAAAEGARRLALAVARHRNASGGRGARVAVRHAVTAAHRIEELNAGVRPRRADPRLIGSAAEGLRRERAELALGAAQALQAAARVAVRRGSTLAEARHADARRVRDAGVGVRHAVA